MYHNYYVMANFWPNKTVEIYIEFLWTGNTFIHLVWKFWWHKVGTVPSWDNLTWSFPPYQEQCIGGQKKKLMVTLTILVLSPELHHSSAV